MKSTEDDAKRMSLRNKEEDDLAKALRLSEEEDARRKRELEEANKNALFNDNLNLTSNNQYTQQPQQGYPLMDLGYGQQLQPQYTSFNPFHAQMLQQQQQEEYMRQQLALQEQQRLQQEEYYRQQYLLQQQQQQQQQQQALLAQPTGYGSNNPFAPAQPQQQQPTPQPQQQSSFLPVPVVSQQQPASPQPTPQPQPAFNPRPQRDDGQHSGLAALLARGREDGMDTFGNTGNLRIPVGTGFHQKNQLAIQQTGFGGNNPFGQAQQQPKPSEQPFFSI